MSLFRRDRKPDYAEIRELEEATGMTDEAIAARNAPRKRDVGGPVILPTRRRSAAADLFELRPGAMWPVYEPGDVIAYVASASAGPPRIPKAMIALPKGMKR